MKKEQISTGGKYLCWTTNGFEIVQVLHQDSVMGYWVKDTDGECFWADAEELEEV